MAVFTSLFKHEMQLVGAEQIHWGRPIVLRNIVIFFGTGVGLRIATRPFVGSIGPISTLITWLVIPLLVVVARAKRFKGLGQRTLAEFLMGKAHQTLAPEESHNLTAMFEGFASQARFVGVKLLETFLPHTSLRPRLHYAEGHIIFTKDGEVYAGYVRETNAYNDPNLNRKGRAYREGVALWRERIRHGSGHEQIMSYKTSYDALAWAKEAMNKIIAPPSAMRERRRDPEVSWRRLVSAEAELLQQQGFRVRRTLHFHYLGRRQVQHSQNLRASLRNAAARFNYTIGASERIPPREEIIKWLAASQPVTEIFRKQGARVMTTGDLYDVIVHQVWRGYKPAQLSPRPVNTPMAAQDFKNLMSGPVRLKGKGEENAYDVRVFQGEKVFVAHCVITLPTRILEGPGHELLYMLELAEDPNTGSPTSVDITITSDYFDRVEGGRRLSKKIDLLQSNKTHYETYGEKIPDEWNDELHTGYELLADIKAGRDALLRTEIVLTVEGTSIAVVQSKIAELRRILDEHEIQVQHLGDLQQRLAAAVMPTNGSLVPEYRQWINAGFISGSGLTSAIEIGSKEPGANLFGHVTYDGDCPVFLDPREARRQNRPGGIAIGGDQGGGKSQTGKRIGVELCKQGVPGIIFDFKAQETNRLFSLFDVDSEIWDLTGDIPGQLDPYINFPQGAARPAFEALSRLLGHHAGAQMSLDVQSVLRDACNAADEIKVNRSMMRVLEFLSQSTAGLTLYHFFVGLLDYDLSKLFFAPDGMKPRNKIPQLMAIQIAGLSLPEREVQPADYSDINWLSIAAVEGVAWWVRSLAQHAGIPNLFVFFDESHVLEKTNIGNVLLETTSRFSRFQGIIPVLGSQGIAELARYGKHFSTRMLFRITDPDEQELALRFIGWPVTDENKSILAELEDGECIFRDLYGRTAIVQIMVPLEEYKPAFDTTLSEDDWRSEYAELLEQLEEWRHEYLLPPEEAIHEHLYAGT